MAIFRIGKNTRTCTPKKTKPGNGTFSKTPHGGGETFHDGKRSGSPPSKAHRRKKSYRGQGR